MRASTMTADHGVTARGVRARVGLVPPGLFKFSAAHFLAALILFIFLSPFVNFGITGQTIEAVLLTLVLLSGTLAVGRRRLALMLAIFVGLPAVLVRWLEHFQAEHVPSSLMPLFTILFVALVIMELTRFILLAPSVDHEVVCAGVSAFISMGLLWGFAYLLVARLSPNAFAVYDTPKPILDAYELQYFSFVTLTGIAYGDITPLSHVAQMLVVLEGLAGTFYIVILIGRLVAMYTSHKASHPA